MNFAEVRIDPKGEFAAPEGVQGGGVCTPKATGVDGNEWELREALAKRHCLALAEIRQVGL
jgi:hypothetical protein